jgi:hypothetical protein
MLLLCVQIHALNEGCLCCVGRLSYTIHGVPLVSTGLLRMYTGKKWVGDEWGGRIYTGTIVMYVGEASADPSADPLAMSGVGNSWVVALPGSVRMSMH